MLLVAEKLILPAVEIRDKVLDGPEFKEIYVVLISPAACKLMTPLVEFEVLSRLLVSKLPPEHRVIDGAISTEFSVKLPELHRVTD